jgi:DNA-binding CsgD family transcriptional regulator
MTDREAHWALAGAIYDCVFQPERWSGVLERIQQEVGAASSYLIVHETDPRRPKMAALIEINVDRPMLLLYHEHYVRLNPLLPHLASFRDGEVYSCRHLVVRPDYLRGEFYQEWAGPQGWFDYAGVTLIRKRHTSAAVGFTRLGNGNVFDDPSLHLIRRLAPHLARAAELQRMMESERESRRDLTRLIGRIRCGFLIVDSGMRVLEANPAGQALLAKNEGLTYREGKLAARETTGTLQAAVRGACGNETAHPAGATLAVNRGAGRRPLVLQIVRLAGHKNGSAPEEMFSALLPSTAAVFVIDPEKEAGSVLDIFVAIHQITAAERQVLERLAAGDSASEIGRALEIGIPTVRTHLHRLFDKTGARRQPELLTLLARFTPPIQSPDGT